MLIVKSFATPIVWVLALLILGLVLTAPSRRRRLFTAGRLLLFLGVALLIALSLNPVANWLAYPLESRYRQPAADVLDRLDLVVVLGGGTLPASPLRPGTELGKYSLPRFYHGVRFFRQSGADLLAFCGGPPREGAESEAQVMKAMAMDLGVPAERIVAETESHNTFENLANLARLLPVGEGRRIGLVTAATHMRRSCRVAVRQFPHDTIIPIPVHFTYDPIGWSQDSVVPSVRHLERSTVALREWVGLVWYRLRHR
jgi:uncharacterized SAM-binding protein YcdF (DUF218 family)